MSANASSLSLPETFFQDVATVTTSLDAPIVQKVYPSEPSEQHAAFLTANSLVAARLPADCTVQAIAVGQAGAVFIGANHGLFRASAGEVLLISPDSPASNIPDGLLHSDIRALALDMFGGLWVGTARGLNYWTGESWLALTAQDGLPVCDITHLCMSPEGSLWIGTPQGVIRLRAGQWRYYAGKRWLPDDCVTGLHVEANGDCWVRTATGAAHIAFVPTTLPQKAAHYEQITATRHNRDGYVTDCRLTRPGDLDSFLPEASDNDGLWTSLYVCAESFRFAVTGEPEAQELARRSLFALLDLVHVTGIPGFPARALIREGERVHQSDPGPNWYASPTQPGVLYKADTSSDELAGHYLAWYVYSTLVADAEERAAIATVCRAVTNSILDHHYTLVGPTGKRTTWGVWSPEVLNDDPDWSAEQGLNSLEILSHLKVATHLCSDARFAATYYSLIVQHGYALNTVRQKVLPPAGENNHSDDELAVCAYYPLLILETDPVLRGLYLLSLERTQAILRPENSPFYNFLYAALSGRPCDRDAAVQWLRDAPWDLRHWTMNNSHRADITLDTSPGRFGEKQALRPLPPNEKRVTKWNHNPYALDGGEEGRGEEDGTFWLLPYWLARYHGLLTE